MVVSYRLVCHPDNLNNAVETLRVGLNRSEDGSLHLRYELRGDLTGLRIPQPQMPDFRDGLWRHTCFEAFIAVQDATDYLEFNFSPSRQWAAYKFDDYRIADAAWQANAPLIEVTETGQGLQLEAVIAANAIPKVAAGKTLILGLTAVLEDIDGNLSYWALHHPSAQPDFHHRGGFIGKLAC